MLRFEFDIFIFKVKGFIGRISNFGEYDFVVFIIYCFFFMFYVELILIYMFDNSLFVFFFYMIEILDKFIILLLLFYIFYIIFISGSFVNVNVYIKWLILEYLYFYCIIYLKIEFEIKNVLISFYF